MLSCKTIYFVCIILCLMGYTDSGVTTEDQKLCQKDIRDDFDYPNGNISYDVMTLPKRAFKDRVLDQFKTTYGLNYFNLIMEKATPGLTESPKVFCSNTRFTLAFPSTLCMEQLNEVYEIVNENDALSVIKWTYINKKESTIPKVFDATNGEEVKRFEHFAYSYFQHMYTSLDVYTSMPKPIAFCQSEEPYFRDRNQNYRNINEVNPGESSEGEMTVKKQRRISKRKRRNPELDTDSLND